MILYYNIFMYYYFLFEMCIIVLLAAGIAVLTFNSLNKFWSAIPLTIFIPLDLCILVRNFCGRKAFQEPVVMW